MEIEIKGKRNKMEIIHDILLIVQNSRNAKKTHLMYKANLSYKQMKTYLQELLDKGFVEGNSTSEDYSIKITKKGTNFMGKYTQMKEFEKTFGL